MFAFLWMINFSNDTNIYFNRERFENLKGDKKVKQVKNTIGPLIKWYFSMKL